jgi:hypothetical protein
VLADGQARLAASGVNDWMAAYLGGVASWIAHSIGDRCP